MSYAFSIYLDLVRFLAATLVFLWHSRNVYHYEGLIFKLGHEAVIVFFVLSGLVIAYSNEAKEKSLLNFAVNRASRIYSVALPAILITFLLDLLSSYISPENYGDLYDHVLVRFLSSLMFLNEIWVLSIQTFSNVPYWSINYEVWYYISFAVVYYAGKWRIPLIVICCLIVGPKILLLAPCWWIGVWIYKRNPLRNIPLLFNASLYVISTVGFGLFISYGLSWWAWDTLESIVGKSNFVLFAFSRHFMTDYLLAAIIALNFATARVLCEKVRINRNGLTDTIVFLANTTFSLYLLHQPVINFFHAVFLAYDFSPKSLHFIVSGVSFILIVLVGNKIEKTKIVYRKFFHRELSHGVLSRLVAKK